MENFLMSPIHKKGSEVDCENYKGIAVTRTVSRMYGGLLRNKIKREYKDYEAEEQSGFRIGRSTVHHCIAQVIEKKTAVNQEVHLLYVDLQKAFDNVPQ